MARKPKPKADPNPVKRFIDEWGNTAPPVINTPPKPTAPPPPQIPPPPPSYTPPAPKVAPKASPAAPNGIAPGETPQPGKAYVDPGTIVGNLAGGIQNNPPDGSGGDNSGSGSSGSSGSDSGKSNTLNDEQLFASVDANQILDFFQMPSDIKNALQKQIAQWYSAGKGLTPDQIAPLAVAYLRGTDWYSKTYVGIQYGVSNGLFDESQDMEVQYRRYVNDLDVFSQQYLGRNVSTQEVANYLQQGLKADVVGKQLEGQSYANAYGKDWDAIMGPFGAGPLDANSKLALGEYETGYKTTFGDTLERQLQQATTRMKRIFEGTLATPADLQRRQTLAAPGLSTEVTPDVGAI